MTPRRKHPCPDCKVCQWCSDDRCRPCRRTGCAKKLSIAEQLALYESVNAAAAEEKKRSGAIVEIDTKAMP